VLFFVPDLFAGSQFAGEPISDLIAAAAALEGNDQTQDEDE
jgi:hypothetical protein